LIIMFVFLIIALKLNANEDAYINDIKKYSQIIKKDPTASWAFEGRGYAYFNLKKFNKAKNDFKSASKIKPSPSYYSQLAEVYIAVAKYKKAIIEIEKALKHEDAYMYYCLRAICYDMLGNYKQAFKDYLIYLEQKSFSQNALNRFYISSIRMAIFLYNKKDYKNALVNVKNAIKASNFPGSIFKNPNDDIYYIKFLINLKLDNFEEAKNDLQIVLRNGFNNKTRINFDIKDIRKEYKIEIEKIIKSNMVKSKKLNDIDFYDKKYLVNKFLGFE